MQIEPNSYSESWHMRVVKTLDEIETIRPIWEQMQAAEPYPIINADVDRYLSVLKAEKGRCQPLVLLFRKDKEPVTMLIGRREKQEVRIRCGYTNILRPKLTCMTVVYGGVLGRPNERVSRIVIRELMRIMRREDLHAVFFNHLRTDSAFYQQVRRIPSFACRNYRPATEPHYRMRVPRNMDEFFAACSKNQRKHYRRYEKKLAADYHDKVSLRTYKSKEEVPLAIADAARISQCTYQNEMGVGFADSSHTRILLETAAEKGWFRAHIMYIDREPAAFRFALKYGQLYYGDGIGYDPKWKDYNIGTVSLLKVLGELCKENGISYYDFGFGGSQWKEVPGTERWQEAAATYLFAPSIYPLLINTICTVSTVSVCFASYVMRKTGVYDWIKRTWRQHLRRRAQKSTGESSHE